MTPEIKKRIEQIRNGDVPEGYKRTKAGIIPEKWEIKKLSDVLKKQTQKNTDNAIQNVLTNSATQGIVCQTDYFDKQIANNENTAGYYVVKPGYFVYNPRISVSAPCGPFNRYNGDKDGIMSPLYSVYCFCDKSITYANFLTYYFSSSKWYAYMNSIANYGARSDRMNVTGEDMNNMPIPYSPLPEQQKIVAILSAQDKVIECYEKKIEQLRLIKKYYLQNMFPKRGETVPKIRFKGFTDAWEQRKLSEIGERVTRKNQDLVSELPLTISAQYGLIDQNEFFDKRIASKDVSGYYLVKNGEFAYNKSTSVDAPWGAVKRLDKYEMGVLSTLYIVFSIIDKGKTDSDFLVTYYDTNLWHNGVQAVAAEGARNHGLLNISADDFLEISLSLPQDIEEQKLIGSYFRNLDNLITLHQRLCEEEKKKKKALQQLLLTGIVRTNE